MSGMRRGWSSIEGNDIGVTLHARYACRFEGLIMREKEEPKPGFFDRFKNADRKAEEQSKMWRANEMPLKSLIHITSFLGVDVAVITYMSPEFVPIIENWLARKGAHVQVFAYDDPWDWLDDFKYDREISTYFTADEEDARVIGIRATVVSPDQTWGF